MPIFGWTQILSNTRAEIRLVNENVGAPQFNFTVNSTTESNDSGLNTILHAHNVYSYIQKGGHLYTLYANRYVEISCDNCNYGQLSADLAAYSSVVAKARVTVQAEPFDDCLYLQIQNSAIGVPIGISNGVVVTNDAILNQIFLSHNVFYYQQTAPTTTDPNLIRVYNIACNCDNIALKSALDNYTALISYTEYPQPAYLLNNSNFEKTKTIISPNPFSNNFDIQTEQMISNYSIIDITGKTICNTTSKAELDTQASNLSSGIYILNLDFDNGLKVNYKLIKK